MTHSLGETASRAALTNCFIVSVFFLSTRPILTSASPSSPPTTHASRAYSFSPIFCTHREFLRGPFRRHNDFPYATKQGGCPIRSAGIVINGHSVRVLQERCGSLSHLVYCVHKRSTLSTLIAERLRTSSHGIKVRGLSQSGFPNSLICSPLLPHTVTQQAFEMSTMSYSIPPSFYDIPPNDYLQNYTNQLDSKADMGFGGYYNFPAAAVELVPAYPTCNGLPLFQSPPSFPSSSSSSVAPSTPWESPSSQPSISLSDELSQPLFEPKTEGKKVKPAVKQLGKRKRQSDSVGRTGDQTKRPAGMGFAAMFVRLS